MQFINRIKLQLSSSFIWFVAVPLSPFRFVAVFVAVLTYTIFVAIDQWLSPFWPMVVTVLTNGCRHFDLCLVAVLTTIVAVFVVAVLDLSPFLLSPFRLVAVLTCIPFNVVTYITLDILPFNVVTYITLDILPFNVVTHTVQHEHRYNTYSATRTQIQWIGGYN